MTATRITQHVIILAFLFITLAAFVLTMFHRNVPFFPAFLRPVILYSYGMMAPYQSYERYNAALRAEGRERTGEWRTIDLDPYFPVLRGERKVREFMWIYGNGIDAEKGSARGFAAVLLNRERARGHMIGAVRLFWDQWQPSPLGFDALRGASGSYVRPLITFP